MRTSKPIATISYNTDNFLQKKLSTMVEQGKIDFFCYVQHMPEDDETKFHKHLFIIPSGYCDTTSLKNEFAEMEPGNEKSLGVINFVSSKFGDWFMYALHDKDYLRSKGLERKYHYNLQDFYASDENYFNELLHTADFTRWKCEARFKELVRAGLSFGAILDKGAVPMNLISQFKVLYTELTLHYNGEEARVYDVEDKRFTRSVFK